jgi:hypothetical protein
MQRGQYPLGMLPRQIGYPLSFRGQVCGTQRSLPCFSSMALNAWWLPFLQRVLLSPVPRPHRYYEATTTSRRACPSAYVFVSGFRMALDVRVRFRASDNLQGGCRTWSVVQPVLRDPGASCGRRRDLSGSQVTHPAPLPCSETPAESVILAMADFLILPPDPTRRRLQRLHDFEANTRLRHPAVYASRATSPSPLQDSLPAGRLRLCREGVEPSGSQRKVSGYIRPPFQGLP